MVSEYRSHIKHIHEAKRVLDELKLASGCVDCGFNEWPEALQFDHIEPCTKLRSLGWFDDRSKLHSKTRLRRYLEHVDRYCQIRCANCHAHRTKTERHHMPHERNVDYGPTLF